MLAGGNGAGTRGGGGLIVRGGRVGVGVGVGVGVSVSGLGGRGLGRATVLGGGGLGLVVTRGGVGRGAGRVGGWTVRGGAMTTGDGAGLAPGARYTSGCLLRGSLRGAPWQAAKKTAAKHTICQWP